jgi:hypothetical protein
MMIVGTSFASGVLDAVPALAAEQEKDATKSGPRDRSDSESDPAKRIDRAIQEYEGRADQELSQIRKQITQLRAELGELCDLQCDMAVSLAELQAEMRVQAVTSPDSETSAAGASGQDRQRMRSIELAREFRQVQDSLRSIVQQKRSETDQLVLQLRNLRAQQRQAMADRERNAHAPKPSQD